MQKVFNWLSSHVRGIVIMAIFLAILSGIVAFFSANAILNVSAPANFNGKNIEISISTDAEMKKVGNPGLLIVPRATKSIIASAGDYVKTQTLITMPWYGYTEVPVSLQRDKDGTKIPFYSTQSDACMTYSTRLESLLHYKCRNPTTLVQYQTPTSGLWKNTAVASSFIYPNQSAKPYAGGILGITDNHGEATDDHAPSPLAFVSDDGKFHYYNAPSEIEDEELSRATLFTNTVDQTDKRFVLVTSDGDIYLGSPIASTDTIDYHKFESSFAYTQPRYQTLCEIRGDNAICNRGEAPVGDTEESDGKTASEVITTYSFEGREVSSVPVAQKALLDSFHATSNGKLYGKYHKKLLAFELKNGKYHTVELTQNADTVTVNDSVYYTQAGGVFMVDSHTSSHQVFYTKKANIKNLVTANNKIIAIGTFNDGNNTALHAYQLNDDANDNPGTRIIDLLPADTEKLTGVTYQNFVGNKLYLNLALATSKKSTNAEAARRNEINNQKQIIVEELKSSGVDIDSLEIVIR